MTYRSVDRPPLQPISGHAPATRVSTSPAINQKPQPSVLQRPAGRELTNFPLFKDIQQDVREKLTQAAQWHKAGKHAVIVAQGGLGSDLFMVVNGCILLSRTRSNGSSQVVGILFAGDVFGATEVGAYLYTARTAVCTALLGFDHGVTSTLSDRHPSLRRALYQSVTSDVGLAQDHLVLLGALSARERVAVALLHFDRRQLARDTTADKPLWLPMRRTDLASYLGIELATLSRTLARFRDHGLIKIQSTSQIHLCDRPRLARLAGDFAVGA